MRLFIISVVGLSLLGAYIGLKGKKVIYQVKPGKNYQEIQFNSLAKDKLVMGGWYLPSSSQNVAIIVHGWGGNRSRYILLAKYLQQHNISVLTFDVRAGTGKNTYGQRESQDLAGAIAWLQKTKNVSPENITVIGASMGGAATITYALNHPIGKMVLVGAVVDINQTKYQALRNRNFIFPEIYATGATLVERVFYGVKPINPKDKFTELTMPVLVLHAVSDELSPTKTIRLVERSVTQAHKTNIEFVYIPGAKHNLLDDDGTRNFMASQRIVDFIQNVNN
jgi:alpha-beta hydrolase superfamily lysophospholipase